MDKLNANKEAVLENKHKLENLLRMEQRLNHRIQKNIENQYELLNSSTASAFGVNMLVTTN